MSQTQCVDVFELQFRSIDHKISKYILIEENKLGKTEGN